MPPMHLTDEVERNASYSLEYIPHPPIFVRKRERHPYSLATMGNTAAVILLNKSGVEHRFTRGAYPFLVFTK